MERKARVWGGKEGRSGVVKGRGEGRGKRRHGTRRWPARGTEAEVNRRRRRVPRRPGENREERERGD